MQDRITDVAARSQHRIRPELLQDSSRFMSRLDDVFHGGDIVPHIRQVVPPA